MTLSLADYSVKDVVHNVFSSVESLAKNKKLALTIELPKTLPVAHGDERRLTQVLLNLVGNAIKFTDEGEVAIKAASVNGSVTLSVHDTGPGIAEADQRKIFEEFQQADSSTTRKRAGPASALPFQSGLWRCMAADCGSSSASGMDRPSHSPFPFMLSDWRYRHDQAHPRGRRSGRQSTDPTRSL